MDRNVSNLKVPHCYEVKKKKRESILRNTLGLGFESFKRLYSTLFHYSETYLCFACSCRLGNQIILNFYAYSFSLLLTSMCVLCICFNSP